MIINANSVHIPLPDNSVQCVVTSPPYWGLRKYDGAQDSVWGGDADCHHDWKQHHQPAKGGKSHPDRPSIVGANRHMSKTDLRGVGIDSDMCQRCGAWRGGLGLEPTPEMFIDHMVQIFQEVKRVLRDDGVAWVNMGDSYSTRLEGHGGFGKWTTGGSPKPSSSTVSTKKKLRGIKPKNLLLIPHRLALALQADGWWVRSDTIWAKPNPMPESLKGWRWEQCKTKVAKSEHATVHNIKGGHKKMLEDASVHQGMSPEFLAVYENCTGCDKCRDNDGLVLRRGSWRPTSSHEHIFMLAKSSMYYSDGEAVREKNTFKTKWNEPNKRHLTRSHGNSELSTKTGQGFHRVGSITAGRNLRNVWNIPTAPYKGAHYATFPPELARRCVLSSTSRHACSECGMAWSRKLEKPVAPYKDTRAHGRHVPTGNKKISGAKPQEWLDANPAKTLGYRPSCQCDADTRPCVVLDVFAGSGTVGQVCRELPYQRDFVGVDISYEYLHGQALLRSERITTEASLQELPMFKEMIMAVNNV